MTTHSSHTRRAQGRSRTALGAAAVVATLAASAPALSETQLNALQRHDAWAVFANEKAAEPYCYAATVPVKTVASKDGIRRGQPFLIVSHFPAQGVANEVSVKLGFPAKPEETVKLVIGGASFDMFTEGEQAWLAKAEDDAKVVTAMRRGARAEITSISKRGTKITDEYSLIGFSKATARAAAICKK